MIYLFFLNVTENQAQLQEESWAVFDVAKGATTDASNTKSPRGKAAEKFQNFATQT